MGHNGRHPKDWLSGNPTVQRAEQAAGTSEVVASFADAFTSVSVLAEPLCRQVAPVCRLFLMWFYGHLTCLVFLRSRIQKFGFCEG